MQGVFFRVSAKNKADELGIKGEVKNTADGGVEIKAEGEEDLLRAYLLWCNQGPQSARVEKIDAEWLEVQGWFDNFCITY